MGATTFRHRNMGPSTFSWQRRGPKRSCRNSLLVEPLEDRRLLSAVTLTPTSFDDSSDPNSGSLRAAIIAANAVKGKASVTIQLEAGPYTLSIANDPTIGHETGSKMGDLNITNTSHTLLIQGQGTSAETGTIIDQTVQDRVFEIVNAGVKVVFEDLVIEGGVATESGGNKSHSGFSNARGGGILNDGGNVTLNDVVLQNNSADGGATSGSGPGRPEPGQGGGIYSAGGVVTLVNTTVEDNTASGYSANSSGSMAARHKAATGGGGKYANQGALTLSAVSHASTSGLVRESPAAKHFNGVNGMDGQGGGLYMTGGKLSLSQGLTFSNNSAQGGGGGAPFWTPTSAPAPLNGGTGGKGGNGQGGGMYVSGVTMTLSHVTFSSNTVQAGNGGAAAALGVRPAAAAARASRRGGNGGNAGNAQGGGIYISGGTATLTAVTLDSNSVQAGNGGGGGSAATSSSAKGAHGGNAGNGGSAAGGGVYLASGKLTLTSGSQVTNNSAASGTAGQAAQGMCPARTASMGPLSTAESMWRAVRNTNRETRFPPAIHPKDPRECPTN